MSETRLTVTRITWRCDRCGKTAEAERPADWTRYGQNDLCGQCKDAKP